MAQKSTILLIALLLFSALTGWSFGQEKDETTAYISDLTATTSDTHLLLFGTLRNSFSEEMIEGLHSGIPIKFSFFVELHQQSDAWSEKLLESQTFTHILTYDALKETYRVVLEENTIKKYSFSSLIEAQKILNELNGIKVVSLFRLTPDRLYTLQVRAELFNKTLPLSLHRVVPFVSWWDRQTDWQTLKFKY